MSKETMEWLNNNTLIGYTAKRGNAWHYRADEQGDESNHYPGPIPVADVKRRLFDWEPVSAPLEASILTESGVTKITDTTRQVIVRPDTAEVLGVFKSSYKAHGYGEWLVDNVESILDADLQIGSAGLLKGGAQAWVQVEMADTLEVKGLEFRPFMTAATSLDGSLATTYLTGCQLVVCDNTMQMALNAKDAAKIKIKHTTHSLARIADVREALAIVHGTADAFAAEVAELTSQKVSKAKFQKFVNVFAAPGGRKGTTPSPRAIAAADRKADKITAMYFQDPRVAPWAGTAFGVVQAVNTYLHHEVNAAGRSKADRNAEATLTGAWAKATENTLAMLAGVR